MILKTFTGFPGAGRQLRRLASAGAVGVTVTILLGGCGSAEPTPSAVATTQPAIPATATSAPMPTNTSAPDVAVQPISPLNESPLVTPTSAQDGTHFPSGDLGQAAFVRDGILYLQQGPSDADLVALDDCSAGNCIINQLDWSPGGDYLLYYLGSYDKSVPNQIRLASSDGITQTLTTAAAYVQPAAWSPHGKQVAYRTDTDRYAEADDGPSQHIQELWTVAIGEDGAPGEPQLHGELRFGEGCGGGGRSESANAYEREGGFAYGYMSGIMDWTPSGILLYSDNCSTRGVSRFDLNTDAALDPYPGNLRSLSLNHAGDGWVAIDGDNHIVTGGPDITDTTVISTSASPEMVFFGQQSGLIYYTTLVVSDAVDLSQQSVGTLDPAILIFPYFDTTIDGLVALDPATGIQTQLDANDGYAFARVAELGDGSLLFSRVEENAELHHALENGVLSAENWRDYLPTVDLLGLTQGGKPVLLLANAEQYTPANAK